MLLTTCTVKGKNGHISCQKQSNRSKSDKGGVTDEYRVEERKRITSQNTYAINLKVTHGNDLSEQLGNRKSKVGLRQKGVLKSIGKQTDEGIGLKNQGIPNKGFSGPLAIFTHKKNQLLAILVCAFVTILGTSPFCYVGQTMFPGIISHTQKNGRPCKSLTEEKGMVRRSPKVLWNSPGNLWKPITSIITRIFCWLAVRNLVTPDNPESGGYKYGCEMPSQVTLSPAALQRTVSSSPPFLYLLGLRYLISRWYKPTNTAI